MSIMESAHIPSLFVILSFAVILVRTAGIVSKKSCTVLLYILLLNWLASQVQFPVIAS
jgi:hypothetical protein